MWVVVNLPKTTKAPEVPGARRRQPQMWHRSCSHHRSCRNPWPGSTLLTGVSRVGDMSKSTKGTTASEHLTHGIRRRSRCQHARNHRFLPTCRDPARHPSGDRHGDRGLASQAGRPRDSAANPEGNSHLHSRLGAQKTGEGVKVSGYHYVRPYRRRNGSLVRGHLRRNPRPRVGAVGVLLFIALLALLGGLMRGHASETSIRTSVGTTQPSGVTPAKTP